MTPIGHKSFNRNFKPGDVVIVVQVECQCEMCLPPIPMKWIGTVGKIIWACNCINCESPDPMEPPCQPIHWVLDKLDPVAIRADCLRKILDGPEQTYETEQEKVAA
jgi:hypothetical protein